MNRAKQNNIAIYKARSKVFLIALMMDLLGLVMVSCSLLGSVA